MPTTFNSIDELPKGELDPNDPQYISSIEDLRTGTMDTQTALNTVESTADILRNDVDLLQSNVININTTISDITNYKVPILLSSATASNSPTVVFNTGIDSTYNRYLIQISDLVAITNNTLLRIRTSTDNGSNFDAGGSDYRWASIGLRSGGIIDTESSAADGRLQLNVTDTGLHNVLDSPSYWDIQIYSPSNTAIRTSIAWEGNGLNSVGNAAWSKGEGIRDAAESVNAIQILLSAGNISSGTFQLYGIQNS